MASENSFTSGLQATNDIYARHSGLVPPEKGDNLVERNDEEIEVPDAAESGLAPVEGAAAPAKPAAKKAAAKKAPAKDAK